MKGTTEDEMVGWHHCVDRHEFGQALGVGDGQGSVTCCSPWGCKASDMTKRLNWIGLIWWCLCVESSLVLLEDSVCCDQWLLLVKHFTFVLQSTLPCFILYSKAKLSFHSRYLFTSYFCIPIPMMRKTSFFVLVLEGLVGLHRIIQLQLLQR